MYAKVTCPELTKKIVSLLEQRDNAIEEAEKIAEEHNAALMISTETFVFDPKEKDTKKWAKSNGFYKFKSVKTNKDVIAKVEELKKKMRIADIISKEIGFKTFQKGYFFTPGGKCVKGTVYISLPEHAEWEIPEGIERISDLEYEAVSTAHT